MAITTVQLVLAEYSFPNIYCLLSLFREHFQFLLSTAWQTIIACPLCILCWSSIFSLWALALANTLAHSSLAKKTLAFFFNFMLLNAYPVSLLSEKKHLSSIFLSSPTMDYIVFF